MFSYGYQSLPRGEAASPRSSGGLPQPGFPQPGFQRGLSFDYVPNVAENDFSDTSQGWLSWICNVVVISLVYLLTFITFPVSGWFVLKSVPNYQRIVVFRLGRVCPPKGPGTVLALPLIDRWQRVDLRTRAFNVPPCQVITRDGGVLSVGADTQFRIWNPVLSVVAVQDLNASTRMTAQNALTHSLSKKTVREIQTERVKLGEYLGMDINEMTRPWGLEVDRVELTFGSLRQPSEEPTPGAPQSAPGLEGLAGPIQQLAMHFLGGSQPHHGNNTHTHTHTLEILHNIRNAISSGPATLSSAEAGVTFTDELSVGAGATGSAEELLGRVRPLLSEALVRQVAACFQFHVSSPDGRRHSYFVDLSQGGGAAGSGSPCREPDVTLSLSDGDLSALMRGELQPLAAYTAGRLRVQGDVQTAMRLDQVIQLLKKHRRV